MKVYQVLEHFAYEGFAEPDSMVFDSREKAEARILELYGYDRDLRIFELEVK
jgi:hypothetical protein